MNDSKNPKRRKGRAETVIEDLAEYGLTVAGINLKDGTETIIPIDTTDPYKDGGVFGQCELYRVFSPAGLPVIDKKHLSGIRKWIDSGEIQSWEDSARQREFEEELLNLIKGLTTITSIIHRK